MLKSSLAMHSSTQQNNEYLKHRLKSKKDKGSSLKSKKDKGSSQPTSQ